LATLVDTDDRVDELLGHLGRQDVVLRVDELAVDADLRRGSHREVEVRTAALNHQVQQLFHRNHRALL
jgi:hypothetical protein